MLLPGLGGVDSSGTKLSIVLSVNTQKVVAELNLQYPGKKIVLLPPQNPTEIICEIERSPKKSVAIAVIEKSKPHFHKKLAETYRILRGALHLFVDGEKLTLKQGDTYVIKPGQVHWTESDGAWVEVSSVPGWDQEDHILV